mgnify:CR=1 FL=1
MIGLGQAGNGFHREGAFQRHDEVQRRIGHGARIGQRQDGVAFFFQDGLLRVCAARGVRSAMVRARGALEAVDLASPGGTVGGPLFIASLDGTLADTAPDLAAGPTF